MRIKDFTKLQLYSILMGSVTISIVTSLSYTNAQEQREPMLEEPHGSNLLYGPNIIEGKIVPSTSVIQENCYLQREDGSVEDLTSMCTPKPQLPVVQDQEVEMLDDEALWAEVKKACAQLPSQCKNDGEYMNELSRICLDPRRCPASINQILRDEGLRR